jgi:hypothetical protein
MSSQSNEIHNLKILGFTWKFCHFNVIPIPSYKTSYKEDSGDSF